MPHIAAHYEADYRPPRPNPKRERLTLNGETYEKVCMSFHISEAELRGAKFAAWIFLHLPYGHSATTRDMLFFCLHNGINTTEPSIRHWTGGWNRATAKEYSVHENGPFVCNVVGCRRHKVLRVKPEQLDDIVPKPQVPHRLHQSKEGRGKALFMSPNDYSRIYGIDSPVDMDRLYKAFLDGVAGGREIAGDFSDASSDDDTPVRSLPKSRKRSSSESAPDDSDDPLDFKRARVEEPLPVMTDAQLDDLINSSFSLPLPSLPPLPEATPVPAFTHQSNFPLFPEAADAPDALDLLFAPPPMPEPSLSFPPTQSEPLVFTQDQMAAIMSLFTPAQIDSLLPPQAI